MTGRRSERPTPGRLGKSTPAFGKTTPLKQPALQKTPARPSRRPPSEPAKNFAATWPLFGDAAAPAFPAHPATTVHQLAPPSADLAALAGRAPLSEAGKQSERQQQKLTGALGDEAPEWVRAASSLAAWLEERIA